MKIKTYENGSELVNFGQCSKSNLTDLFGYDSTFPTDGTFHDQMGWFIDRYAPAGSARQWYFDSGSLFLFIPASEKVSA